MKKLGFATLMLAVAVPLQISVLSQASLAQKIGTQKPIHPTSKACWYLRGFPNGPDAVRAPLGTSFGPLGQTGEAGAFSIAGIRWVIDCAGNDPRFMEMLPKMWGVCRAFRHHGRLDPNDEWRPESQCYDGLTIEKAHEVTQRLLIC
jgi:hypothetical protein